MTTTARSTPTGAPMTNAHGAFIAFAADPDLKIFETTVGQPTETAGDAINTTTHWNTGLVTKDFKTLADMEEFQVAGQYGANSRSQISALRGVNGWITIHDPEGGTLDFVGGLVSAEYSDYEADSTDPPTVTLTIRPTNQLNGTETDWVYTPPAT